MRKPRHLSPEEKALWDAVARRTEPLDKPAPVARPVAKPAPKPARPANARLRPFQIGEAVDHRRDHDLVAGLSEQLTRAPVAMDRKSHGKLKRGKLKPEARIDLHGMTLAEAHPALTSFLLDSHAKGRRLVLVITGKGKHRDTGGPIPTHHGVLRHQVPNWLKQAPLAAIVLQVAEAHVSHGGHGALYVYLRRHR